MQCKILIKSQKGFYAETELTGRTIPDIFDKVVSWTNRLPTEIDGEYLTDFKSITMELTKD